LNKKDLTSHNKDAARLVGALLETAEVLDTSRDLDELLDRLVRLLPRLISVDVCCVVPWDRDKGIFRGRAVYGLDPAQMEYFQNARFDPEQVPALAKILTEKKPLVIRDLQKTNLFPLELAKPYRMATVSLWPLLARGEVVGLMAVAHRELHRYPPQEMAIIAGIARHAGLAIDNLELVRTLRISQKEWEQTFDAISDMVAICDLENHIMRANRAVVQKAGLPPHTIVGRSCYEVLYSLHEPPDENSANKTVLTGKPASGEVVDLTNKAYYLDSTYPMYEGGVLTGVVHIGRDITRQKEIESRLIQSERLTAVGELVSGVAHELNNPLTAVVGYSGILLETEGTEAFRADLESIRDQALRAARIVQNLQAFAQRRPARPQKVDVNEILERALELMAFQLKANDVEVVKKLSSSLPVTVADHNLIEGVFVNIVTNAIEAMATGEGKKVLTVETEATQGIILITISDTGPGIPEENISRIFDPFFSTKPLGQGTGLGLSMVYGIVKEHQGTVYARNLPTGGVSFVVELPVKDLGGEGQGANKIG